MNYNEVLFDTVYEAGPGRFHFQSEEVYGATLHDVMMWMQLRSLDVIVQCRAVPGHGYVFRSKVRYVTREAAERACIRFLKLMVAVNRGLPSATAEKGACGS